MVGLLPGYKKCFFCGPATGGLALLLSHGDSGVFCEFTAQEKFQGYDGMLHGGIVTGVLDEVMWWTLFTETKIVTATWKIEVEFKRPVMCQEQYHASGQLLDLSHGTYFLSGRIKDASGAVCALSKGSFRKMRGLTVDDIAKYLDFRGVSPQMRSMFKHHT